MYYEGFANGKTFYLRSDDQKFVDFGIKNFNMRQIDEKEIPDGSHINVHENGKASFETKNGKV